VNDLRTLTNAWQTIFNSVKPDVVICDHSPTALLALRGQTAKSVVIGEGFCVPPDDSHLPVLQPKVKIDQMKALADEQQVLANANEVLAALNQPPLERLTQIYAGADDCLLTTFPEFDHFPQRRSGNYVGVWPANAGESFEWPPGDGPRIFAYLHRFPERSAILEQLCRVPSRLAVIANEFSPAESKTCSVPHVQLLPSLVDLGQAAAECDLAVLVSGHGTTAQFLMAGKPVLLLPLTVEQWLLAERVREIGAAHVVISKRSLDFAPALQAMLSTNCHTLAAREFAHHYASFDPQKSLATVVERLERLLS
jgi:UDP:flavonoid glycosyltransferase YjiC (YdhE family)